MKGSAFSYCIYQLLILLQFKLVLNSLIQISFKSLTADFHFSDVNWKYSSAKSPFGICRESVVICRETVQLAKCLIPELT